MVYFFVSTIICTIKLFFSLFPDAECPTGYFGKSCRERCSGHCINNKPCDHVSGECSNGWQDGYIGAHCGDCKKMK